MNLIKNILKKKAFSKYEKLYKIIKFSLDNYNLLNKENNKTNTNLITNEYIKIENNNIYNINISLIYYYIKFFGKIYSNNAYNVFNSFTWNKIQRKNNFLLSINDKTIKIDYSSCFNSYYLS